MSAIETALDFYQINAKPMSKVETIFMESILFHEICNHLLELIRTLYQPYYRLIHIETNKETRMLEGQLFRFIINEILTSGEYTLAGIAYYTDTHEDIIYELATGNNRNPSLLLSKKLISLHRSIKPDFYRNILKQITNAEREAA